MPTEETIKWKNRIYIKKGSVDPFHYSKRELCILIQIRKIREKETRKTSMKKPSVLKTCLIIFMFLTIMNMSNTLFRNVKTEEVTYDEFYSKLIVAILKVLR